MTTDPLPTQRDGGEMPDKTDMRHFGPLHGERSRRHQMTTDSNARRTGEAERGILTMYEVARTPYGDEALPVLHVEVMVDGHTHTLKMTIDEAREAAGAFAEFVREWQSS